MTSFRSVAILGAGTMGARASGLLAPFPIYATIFAVFMHRFDGPDSCAPFLRGVVKAALAATAFFLTFAVAVVQLGLTSTTLAALALTTIAYGLILYAGRRMTWPALGFTKERG